MEPLHFKSLTLTHPARQLLLLATLATIGQPAFSVSVVAMVTVDTPLQ